MKIIVGLGNPGLKYSGTRHNIGFAVINELGEKYNIGVNVRKHKAFIGTGMIAEEKVILAAPQTYMNLSGESVNALLEYYNVDVDDLIVIYDDVDLDVGRLRIRIQGSAGGHNGMKSIMEHLGTQEFTRVRVGVGEKPEEWDLADYVLSRFAKEELPIIRESCTNACEAVVKIITDSAEEAMNLYNRKE